MLTINLSKDAARFLERAHPKHAAQLARKLYALREHPHPPDSQLLKGYPFLRVDSGEYRIIYEVSDDTLSILLIGKRNDDAVYKKLKRK